MTIEAMPVGLRCNLKCTYCYQETPRGDNATRPYDMAAMNRALAAEWRAAGSPGGDAAFVVFGGEPLLLPLADLEAFLAQSHSLTGRSAVQTNASLVTDEHVALFKKYNTHVGVSLDGPGELNEARPSATPEATAETTRKSEAALARLLAEGVGTSLIVTLSTANASRARLPRLLLWLSELQKAGLDHAKLHLMEVDSPAAAALRPPDDELIEALKTLHAAEPIIGLDFTMFGQMLDLLRAKDGAVDCVWGACDPLTTSAVRAIGPAGERLNCARTYKGRELWTKADSPSHARQLALHATPQQHGGCQGCRFFSACKGQCPGEAVDGDWRNRSSYCAVWFAMFAHLEKRLLETRVVPVSLRPDREDIESFMLSEWQEGRRVTVEKAVAAVEGRLRGRPDLGPGEHGDWHSDHNDAARNRRKVAR